MGLFCDVAGLKEKYLSDFEVFVKESKLWFFESIQHKLSSVVSGEPLIVDNEGCKDPKGNLLLKFSKKFNEFILSQSQKGYRPVEAKVNFTLFWKKENENTEIKILLPEVFFERN